MSRQIVLLFATAIVLASGLFSTPVRAQRSPGDYKTFMSYYWDNCATLTPSGQVPFNCPAPTR
jgi:hypothetical protein